MHELTSSTMTEFGIQRLLPVQAVGNPSTVTASSPLHLAKLFWRLDGIGRTSFPGIFFGESIMSTGPFGATLSHVSLFSVSVCVCLCLCLLSVSCLECMCLPVSVSPVRMSVSLVEAIS